MDVQQAEEEEERDRARSPSPPPPEEEEVAAANANATAGPKRQRVHTSYSEEQKDDIIEFLKSNPYIYEKRLPGFKNTQMKDEARRAQAEKMGTTAKELQVYYNSTRTKLGRLKQLAKKSGQGADTFTPTEQWIWDKWQFLAPHISEVQRRDVVSLRAKVNPASTVPSSQAASSGPEPEPEPESEPAPTESIPAVIATPSTSQQPRRTPTPRDPANSAVIGTLLQEFIHSRQVSSAPASYFSMYVERTLKDLPGHYRREAEVRIQQVLHDVEEKAERERSRQK